MTQHRMVFVIGLHRSGTSVLHRILRGHSMVSGFHDTGFPEDEGQYLQDVYPRTFDLGGPGLFGFHPDARHTEESPLARPDVAERLFGQWSRHWDLDKPVLIEKTPQHVLMTRLLQALFPDSRFIVILRHPFANALATQKWSHTSLPMLVDHWIHCHTLLMEDVQKLRNCMVFQYESFVLAPEAYVGRIQDFLSIPAEPVRERIKADGNAAYQALWNAARVRHQDITTLGYDRWRRKNWRANRYLVKPLLNRVWGDDAMIVNLHREIAYLTARYDAALRPFGYRADDFAGAGMHGGDLRPAPTLEPRPVPA
ncbi:MAG TPA: sulfotransferase [Azospirillum sp.]|nr:sulfotransferase [Azospirillum sp.]